MTVIINATEITVEQPAFPELQQLTLSNFKNCNTYRLTPFGAVTFVSDLYSGFISEKKLTRQLSYSTLSWQTELGLEDLELLGVTLNIPPFLKGKKQLDEIVKTRHIAPIRVHVERAMKQLDFSHFLPSSFRDTANQIFFIMHYIIFLHH